MEVKLGYKQTEVGVIPEEWDSEPCAKLCVKIQDGTHFSPTIRGNDYLYLTSKNIRFGYLDISTADRIDAAQHDAIYKRCDVKHGDLLLTKDGANTGNAALNTLTEQFSLLSSVALLRFDPKQHSAAYFLQQCLSAQGQQRMKDAMSGNAITRLTLEKIRKLRFPAAPLPEQRAIAEALSDVDGLLGGLDRLIAKKRDLKQAAMQQLLTGQTRLPGFHGEWEVKTLFELAARTKEFFDDGDWIESEHITTEGIRLIQTGNIGVGSFVEKDDKKYINEASFASLRCKQLKQGDLLVCRLADPAGRACVLGDIGEDRIVTSVDVTIFRPPTELADRQFLSQVFSTSDWFRAVSDRSGGTTHKRISRGALGLLSINLPPLPEQTAIATVLSEMDGELGKLEERREKTRALKQAMMQELLTGKTRLI